MGLRWLVDNLREHWHLVFFATHRPAVQNPLVTWWRSPELIRTLIAIATSTGIVMFTMWVKITALEQENAMHDRVDRAESESIERRLRIVEALAAEAPAEHRRLSEAEVRLQKDVERNTRRLDRLEIYLIAPKDRKANGG